MYLDEIGYDDLLNSHNRFIIVFVFNFTRVSCTYNILTVLIDISSCTPKNS